MKITVLDGYTLNPGDLSWDELKNLGEVTIYDKTPPQLILERSQNAEILITNKTVLDEKIINALPKLRYIGVLATGYNTVDIQAATKRDIPVCNIPSYSSDSVAQLVFAFILKWTMEVDAHHKDVVAGGWSQCEHFCYHLSPIEELKDKTLGVIGFGSIGQRTAQLGSSFGMKILYCNRSPKKPSLPLLEDAKQVSLEELLQNADFVSLNVPQTQATAQMVNHEFLKKMKPGSRLINTGRGGLVDEKAVADALHSGTLKAYAADVLSTEPPSPDNPLLSAPHTLLTPHIAWQSTEARQRLMTIAVENVKGFLNGHIQNRVN